MMMCATTETTLANMLDSLPEQEWTPLMTWLIPNLLPEHQSFIVDRIARRASKETYEDAAQEFSQRLRMLGLKIVPSIKWPEAK